jgi:hypothetical protein
MKPARQLALTFAIAMTGIALSGSPGLAFSSESQQMCDAMRLCSAEIPDIPRVAACMHRKRAQISPGCRAVMDRETALARKARRAAADD